MTLSATDPDRERESRRAAELGSVVRVDPKPE
jgi:hypothetical protein